MNDKPRNNLSYEEAMYGVQTGVAFEIERGSASGSTKHLRVGVNSALCDNAALVRLLIKKGIITTDEITEEVRLEANRELDRYEDRIHSDFGSHIKLR